MFSQRFDSAFCFATKLHGLQARKGTTIPYLGHLLGVTALVIEDGGSEDEAIAALLHDALEDQGDKYPGGRDALRGYIREQFGAAVAAIVDACTDDEGFKKGLADTPAEERLRWVERKRKYVESIAHKTPQALRVTAADKIYNAESIIDSYAAIGSKVWTRFRTNSAQDQIGTYRELSAAINARNDELRPEEHIGLARRLSRAVRLMETLS
jgi:(p)ppGpp synthase/HD superfamily hydrolase